MIKFIKNHLTYKAGDEAANHPNEAYLIKIGVAEMAKEKKEMKVQSEKIEKKATKEKKEK